MIGHTKRLIHNKKLIDAEGQSLAVGHNEDTVFIEVPAGVKKNDPKNGS
ncbi:MAG: hypothetical protein HQK97_01315 [Nitrospirae bacterium]|nr:hypothetical protein [Nitrospirota bacterium]